jgi:hypothetical protein
MEETVIFQNALTALKGILDYSELLSFIIDQQEINRDGYRFDLAFRVEKKKSLDRDYNINKNSVDYMLLGKKFIVDIKANTEPRFLRNTIHQMRKIISGFPQYYPMIVSGFIGPGGRDILRKEGINYMDELGNIGIFLKEGLILVEGRGNIKKEKRELRSLFAPKSTRVLRTILENPDKIWRLEVLSKISKISIGQIYKVKNRLENEEIVVKTSKGLKLLKPSALLDLWRTNYDVTDKNNIESFYSSDSPPEQLVKKLARIAEKEKINYAFTLFAGANMISPYVRTPQVHLYLSKNKEGFIKEADLKPVIFGANVHLLTPFDEGIFNPIQIIEGINIVGNIQLYLDLVNYPARGKEQAEILREKIIGF